MKKVVLSMAALSMLFFVACQGPKKEIARLQFQNDSIAQVNTRLASDIEELLQMIDEIEANFSQITKTEAALNQAQGERLKASIAQIIEQLKDNQEKIATLEKQVRNRNYNIASLKKTVERLKAENEEKAAMITALQAELAQRDAQIKELDASIASLNSKLDALSNENKDQQDQLNAQDQALNTVFYTIGTKKELKAKGILEGGILKVRTLQGVVNDADFTKADLRNVSSIPLNVKKATLMTSPPEGSYTFVKEGKVITELSITNPEEFWSVSKYLVIRK